MFNWQGSTRIQPARRLEEFPSFGSARPQSHARGPFLLLAGTLLVASLCTGASLTLADGARADGLPKRDRLPHPIVLQAGCDGAWGNEPLDCLLQAA